MTSSGEYLEYSGGMFSTLEEYHEYLEGCSVHCENIIIHVGYTMSTLGDIMIYVGNISIVYWVHVFNTWECHEYIMEIRIILRNIQL